MKYYRITICLFAKGGGRMNLKEAEESHRRFIAQKREEHGKVVELDFKWEESE